MKRRCRSLDILTVREVMGEGRKMRYKLSQIPDFLTGGPRGPIPALPESHTPNSRTGSNK
jgi:hypothetical protein